MTDKKITELTALTTPDDADVLPLVDDDASETKKVTWSNVKATLKAYFDTLYTLAGQLPGAVVRARFVYVDDDEIDIEPGVYHHQGTTEQFIFWDSTLTKQVVGAAADTWYYLYLDDTAIVSLGTNLITAAELLFSVTPPTYNESRHGFYSGDDRCIGAFLTDGSGDFLEFFHDGGDLLQYANAIEDLAETDIDTTWTDITLTIPDFSLLGQKAFITVRADDAGQGSQRMGFWRTNGLSGATYPSADPGHLLVSTDTDGQAQQATTLAVMTDVSQIIEVVNSGTGAQALQVWASGYYFPMGM